MKRLLMLLITGIAFMNGYGQQHDDYDCDLEVARLNKIINIIVDQNDRLRTEVDSVRRALVQAGKPVDTFNKRPAVLKSSQLEVLKSIEGNMVKVSGGNFKMGCTDASDTSCYYWEKPVHEVKLKDFYINKYLVTQNDWETIMGYNPCFSKDCPDCPVENVSWDEAQKFIQRLNIYSGKVYRFPTEAEWEYAARGGQKSKNYRFAGGNNIAEVAWYHGNSNKQTHPIGKLKPNELGLYDMCGNVWQWCLDWFDPDFYKNGTNVNPKGPDGTSDNYRVVRGGSWWYDAPDCRISNRDRYPTDAKDDDVGLRLVRD